jgi:hypothetical protein
MSIMRVLLHLIDLTNASARYLNMFVIQTFLVSNVIRRENSKKDYP